MRIRTRTGSWLAFTIGILGKILAAARHKRTEEAASNVQVQVRDEKIALFQQLCSDIGDDVGSWCQKHADMTEEIANVLAKMSPGLKSPHAIFITSLYTTNAGAMPIFSKHVVDKIGSFADEWVKQLESVFKEEDHRFQNSTEIPDICVKVGADQAQLFLWSRSWKASELLCKHGGKEVAFAEVFRKCEAIKDGGECFKDFLDLGKAVHAGKVAFGLHPLLLKIRSSLATFDCAIKFMDEEVDDVDDESPLAKVKKMVGIMPAAISSLASGNGNYKMATVIIKWQRYLYNGNGNYKSSRAPPDDYNNGDQDHREHLPTIIKWQ